MKLVAMWKRVLEVIFGLITLFAALGVLIFPRLGVEVLIILLSIGLVFSGIGWIVKGASSS
jgi:uncharacterized membrane protein HdeD (DUF308 family)